MNNKASLSSYHLNENYGGMHDFVVKSFFDDFHNANIEFTCCNLLKKLLNQQSHLYL